MTFLVWISASAGTIYSGRYLLSYLKAWAMHLQFKDILPLIGQRRLDVPDAAILVVLIQRFLRPYGFCPVNFET